jgi:hypothetical protein
MRRCAWALLLTLGVPGALCAQAPGVPIVRDADGPAPEWVDQAGKLREAGRLLDSEAVKTQLDGASSCRLILPRPRRRPLTTPELWDLARRAHVRVGFYFRCGKCSRWHFEVAGGFALAADGAVATSYHVVDSRNKDKDRNMREGYLLAVTHDDRVLPVTAILAGDRIADVCIVKVQSQSPLASLALNTNLSPGETVWCYHDPAGRADFFGQGIVNRFYRREGKPDGGDRHPLRMNVSIEWAFGSSGSAILDRYGNAVGQVATVTLLGAHPRSAEPAAHEGSGKTVIVFHEAVCAADLLALIRP